jgi:hypothetical protein
MEKEYIREDIRGRIKCAHAEAWEHEAVHDERHDNCGVIQRRYPEKAMNEKFGQRRRVPVHPI